MKLLVLDNYDSFTYNLVHMVDALNVDFDVFRNDKIIVEEVGKYDKIMLSPGPGIPDEAGILKPLIKEYAGKKDILGVCLGHQAIAEVFGGSIYNLSQVHHGVATEIEVVKDDLLFKGLPKQFLVGRYHSWAIQPKELPEELEVTAQDGEGQVMAIRHKTHNIRGVQFHPESILTEHGMPVIKNFLEA